jgi:hypothetical protein
VSVAAVIAGAALLCAFELVFWARELRFGPMPGAPVAARRLVWILATAAAAAAVGLVLAALAAAP